jgi:hypothetical protein
MKILIPHPPGPFLLQEKGGGRDYGGYPQTPPERLSLSGLSAIYNGDSTRGEAPLAGLRGVPQDWGIKGVERAIFARIRVD